MIAASSHDPMTKMDAIIMLNSAWQYLIKTYSKQITGEDRKPLWEAVCILRRTEERIGPDTLSDHLKLIFAPEIYRTLGIE